ncbi:HAD family hydrolase [Stackebrandtia nassauensis]|uniref:HAD-superfamily hydrolase, subfamily IA, variant 3 n=1 Tax=Stackebrandtia nassauensis (strain DSM 44728 / CIP 108903 / NRRL B-16338 / NBRC 102104 / LLR-40K-21) TaxID=446470 RepID=D3Q0X5_STANL|nr:HAD family phosphatase [Stackebrandtia nassauensis]ADD43725.1 HAD-superfamily hydrolase, subfamily IA, variant 3 [Stackebrandtia nassauensis DSM 44728]
MGYRGVVFDMDGVIVESEHLWEESWTASCARRGVDWSGEDTTSVQGMSAPEWARYVAEKIGDTSLADVVQAECVDHVVAAVHDGQAPLLDGARELVVKIADLTPIAMASSAARPVIDAVLDRNELADRFGATVSSEEVARGKPSPDVYAEAAQRVQIEPSHGIAVEDSSNGIRSAHAAGLHVVAIPNRSYPPAADALALAEHVADDHHDALDHILSLLT